MTHLNLQQVIRDYMDRSGVSIKTLASRTRMTYPTLMAVVKEGRVPRKPEHREALRCALDLEPEAWASILACSGRSGIDIPNTGPLTLQQLVLKNILVQGFNERSFALASGIPYPTILNIVAKGAVPRDDTMRVLAQHLSLDPELLIQAIALTKRGRQTPDIQPTSDQEFPVPAHDDSIPSLAQLASDAITQSGASVAAFARQFDIPYVSLMKLLNSGLPPRRKAVLDPLEKALGISKEAFAASLERSKASPTPAEAPKLIDKAMNAFHARLLKLVEDKRYTTKAFAEAADISVLTAAKLLKRGDLPGRQTTHLKLRTLMGLNEADYAALIAEAKPAEEDEDEGPSATTPGYVTFASGAAPIATTKGELFELLDRMSPSQLVALRQFLLTVL